MSKAEKITKLTPEQEAQIPVYLERYKAIGLSTRPTDRVKAEAAIRKAYVYLRKTMPNLVDPEIYWEASPFQGAKVAAQQLKGSMTVTDQEISEQASKASYGSLEAYWVAFYAYIGEVLPVDKDELLDICKELIDELGAYWTFEDAVVLTEKPTAIHMNAEGKLHCDTGKALEYSDGSGLYVRNGVRFGSLMEMMLDAALKPTEATNA